MTNYQVELRRHAVILADGLPVESYLALGDGTNFEGRDSVRLFPAFAARLAPDPALAWEALGTAPLVMAGEQLTAARRVAMETSKHQLSRSSGTTSKIA
jgi:hypothetical protein